jgi:hypothetical protein
MNRKAKIAGGLIAALLVAQIALGADATLIYLYKYATGSIPAASAGNEGALVYDTTLNTVKVSDGSTWEEVGGGLTTLRSSEWGRFKLMCSTGRGVAAPDESICTPGTSGGGPGGTCTEHFGDAPANRYYSSCVSAATTDAEAGFAGAAQDTRVGQLPYFATWGKTGASIANMRIFAGMAVSAGVTGTALAATGLIVTPMVIIGYDSAYDPQWQCCTGNGSSFEFTCVDMGVTVATNTEYEFIVNIVSTSSATCSVNGTEVTVTDDFPASTDKLTLMSRARTLEDVAKTWRWGKMEVDFTW